MKKKQKIPKKIHYCWFGGKPLPESAEKCINSWKKYCPDYEIIRWDESSYDIKKSKFALEAYKAEKWAFVSDYVRLDVIYEYGGIYLDTDVEILKNWDPLLQHDAFMGFEGTTHINLGLGFGATRGNKFIHDMLKIYQKIDFNSFKNRLNEITSPMLISSFLDEKGLIRNGEGQVINGLVLYPQDYFSPKSPITRFLNITKNTFSIHHYDATWVEEKERRYIDQLEINAQRLMKSQSRLVSIIIPVYNGEKYLREAIDSALAQTYKNIEVIVVNDGSTDRSGEIAKSYGNRIRYFEKQNGGVASALNLGIDKMRGYYFSWLSHDDKYYPNKIEKQVDFAKKFDDETIVISNWTIINADGEFIENKYIDSRLEKLPTCFLAFDRKTWLNGCAMLIPRTIFEKYGNFNEELPSTQDYDMWFKISRKIKFRILKQHLLYSRAHSEQGSLVMSSALRDSDSMHSRILESLSIKEVSEYFQSNFKEIWTVYDSFFNNGYKKTPANILLVVVKKFMEEGDYEEVSKILKSKLIGDIDLGKSFDKRIELIVDKIGEKKEKKRLFFCSAHWFTGGVERVLSNLFVKLKDNYEIILITPHTEKEGCIKLPKEVLHIEVSDDLFYNSYDFVIFSYALLLDVDVVIGCMNLFEKILNFYKLAEGSRFKTVASNHEYYFYPYHNPYFHHSVKIREEAFQSVDAVVCLTNFSSMVCDIYNNNGYLIPNPNTFPIQDNEITDKKEKIVLCVGRFNDQVKRIDRVLKCFKKVLIRIPDAKLVLVGKCDVNAPFSLDSNKTIKDLQIELKLSDSSISFVGETENMSKYYSKASLLLLASDNEGFPMVLNEAACFGVPAVCNYIPGIEDIISDGVNGYLTPQDDIETMADRVCDILVDNSLRVKLGEKAKSLARRFEVEKIYKKWNTLFNILTSNYSSEKQKSLLRSNFGFKIHSYPDFTNSICKELNSIFFKNLNYIGIREKEYHASLYNYSNELLEAKSELHEVKSELHEVSEELKKITNSKSWKITKPLRKFRHLIDLIRVQGLVVTTRNIILKILGK